MRTLDKSDIPSKLIEQRMIGDNSALIKEGLIADRPTSPAITRFYYATDENKLYYYSRTSETWVSVTFS